MSLSSSSKPAKGASPGTIVLVGCMIMVCWMPVQMAARAAGDKVEHRPVLFLANASLPPMNFMKHGKPTGIVVDLAEALAARMPQSVEIQLMEWSEAQQRVQEGRGDALLQINPNPDRRKIYDFSEPLLTSEFTIFTSAELLSVHSLDDLRGLRVGVEDKGLPISLIEDEPRIDTVIIPDFAQGFRMLSEGVLDAVIADRWVGSYVLAENKVENVRVVPEPVARSRSAIAVRKGNTELLGEINAALAAIRSDGTYDRILKAWRHTEVLFRTREQIRQQMLLLITISVALSVSLVSVAVLVREIRRRRQVEISLRAAEERFRLFMDHSPAIAWMKDEEGRHVYLNRTFEDRFGVRLEDWRGKTGAEFWPGEVIEEFRRHDLAVLDSGQATQLLEETINPDGSRCHWLSSKFPFVDAAGTRFVAGVGIDITERTMVEEALRQSEERYRLLVETANEGIWSMDGEHVTTYVNQAMAGMLGYSTAEMVGKKVEEFFFPEDRAFHEERMSKRHAGEDEIYERRLRRRDGSALWTVVSAKALKDSQGRFLGSFAMFTDITERKHAEAALRGSLEEKDSLLKEVHHRVKNNLQIVASLLGLQMSRSMSRDAIDVLEDTRNRVKSMALLHETLYRSGNLARINFATYVKDLCGQLMVAYGQSARGISLEQRVEPIGLPLDQAVPCGLIVSELVSNALKHGFPGNRVGKVVVALIPAPGQGFVLTVEDDGVGMPSGTDPTRTGTLGLNLVTRLAKQLRGEMEVEGAPGAGARFRVTFPFSPEAG